MFAAILSIGLMLALNFSNRIQADQELRSIHDKVVTEIDLLRREQTALLDELNYVRSDGFVETWAHSEGKMIRDGEVIVIPKPSALSIEPTPDFQPVIEIDTQPP